MTKITAFPKKLFPTIGLFTIVLLNCSNQLTEGGKFQNNNYTITMHGIDSLQLHMTLAEVEILLQSKITLQYIGKGGYGDTIPVKYKGIDMLLYLEDAGGNSEATLRGIETSSPNCKTETGVGTGSDKMSVINAYPEYTKYIAPEYEVYPVRSSTKFAVAVMDTIDTRALVFHLRDKKVTSVEVRSYYEFY